MKKSRKRGIATNKKKRLNKQMKGGYMENKKNYTTENLSNQIDELLKKYLGENKEAFDEIKNQINIITAEAGEKVSEGFEIVDGYVSENCWKSVAVAAVVGVLAGIIIARK